jgi:4'-phosphopantetheinyl transferase EntD
VGVRPRPALGPLLPATVVTVEARPDPPPGTVFAAEEELVARAVPRRRAEFRAARLCARAAMASLGVAPAPLLRGVHGEPLWPAGVVGSLTHCVGYRAAAVAHANRVRGVGIDAEPNEPLPDGVLDAVTSARERRMVRALAAALPAVRWDRLLFSAKETVFKAWFPLSGRSMPFTGPEIALGGDGTFDARLTAAAPDAGPAVPRRYAGRWRIDGGLLLTAVAVLPDPSEQR